MNLRSISIALLALSLAASVEAGTISGTVRARGVDADSGKGGDGAYSSRRYKFVERVDYESLTDFVVSIEGAPPAGVAMAKEAAVVQRDANFEPHVLPIALGTTVRWPNDDDIYHNVFSMSETTPFDLKLYKKGDPVPQVTFTREGRVDVFCGIHTEMHCIILVLPNPWFAKADSRGRYTIKDVPAGTYTLRAWHERVPSQRKEVVVPAEGEVKVDFVLGVGSAAGE